MKLRFLGGAGTVTGSKHLLETAQGNILIDCGLFQGLKELRRMNWEVLPFDIKKLKAVILTHGHLDHCGYLPILVRQGYQGPIFCSAPTAAVALLILRDSAKIQEADAARANRFGYTKHHPARPLYTSEEAERAIRLFKTVPERKAIPVLKGISARFMPNGHIIGSCWIQIESSEGRVSFSGDLGRKKPLMLRPGDPLETTDILVMESTYGDRLHSGESARKVLADTIRRTVARKGHVLIPAFAIGRTQDLLHLLADLRKKGEIPPVPVFLDTPMGIRATEVFSDYPEWHSLSASQLQAMENISTSVMSQQQSKELLRRRDSTIVIAGSGMITGGRILHHLATRLSQQKNTVILTGYQASGTRGRLLLRGAHELKLLGEFIPVKAEVVALSDLSAHADQGELLDWIRPLLKKPPTHIFLVHGEPQAAEALRVKIESELGLSVSVAQLGESVELKKLNLARKPRPTSKSTRKDQTASRSSAPLRGRPLPLR